MGARDINIKIENCRAISNADVTVSGITVVTGENSSGKSTISKLLYFYFVLINNLERVILRQQASDITSWRNSMFNLIQNSEIGEEDCAIAIDRIKKLDFIEENSLEEVKLNFQKFIKELENSFKLKEDDDISDDYIPFSILVDREVKVILIT